MVLILLLGVMVLLLESVFNNDFWLEFGINRTYTGGDITIYFPISFKHNCCVFRQYTGTYYDVWYGTYGRIYDVTQTSFKCYNDTAHWIAVGY